MSPLVYSFQECASTSTTKGSSLGTTRPWLVLPSKARYAASRKATWIANCVPSSNNVVQTLKVPDYLERSRGYKPCPYDNKCRFGNKCHFWHKGTEIKDISIFVKNLPEGTSDKNVFKIAKDFGEVTRICMLDSKYDDTRSAHVHFNRENNALAFMEFMLNNLFHGNKIKCCIKTDQVYCMPIEDQETTIETTIDDKDNNAASIQSWNTVSKKGKILTRKKKNVAFDLDSNCIFELELDCCESTESTQNTAGVITFDNPVNITKTYELDFKKWKIQNGFEKPEPIKTKVLTVMNQDDYKALSEKKKGKMKMNKEQYWMSIADEIDTMDNMDKISYARAASPSPVDVKSSFKSLTKVAKANTSMSDTSRNKEDEEDEEDIDEIALQKKYDEEYFRDVLFAYNYTKTVKIDA